MLDRRTFREFAGLLVLGPLLVLLGVGLDQTTGVQLIRSSGSLVIGGVVNLLIIFSVAIGSGLAVLGALKVTEGVRMSARRRQQAHLVPVLTTTWSIALVETAGLLAVALMWMTRA